MSSAVAKRQRSERSRELSFLEWFGAMSQSFPKNKGERKMAYQYDIPFHVDLSDRVALVTGGNGGIGGMFCRALAAGAQS